MGKIGKICDILWRSLQGEILRILYNIGLLSPKKGGLNRDDGRREHIVISLTSYGRRVKSCVPTVVCSLLRQSYKADVIVLWLDRGWDDDNLPQSIKLLKQYGLQVKYCDDIRSYKKLVPTLEEYPDSTIITVDDDIYYRRDMVKRLVEAHLNHPGKVVSSVAHLPTFFKDGRLQPYRKWRDVKVEMDHSVLFPVGAGGALYRREYLHSDVTRADKFMALAPNADDIWFYYMALLHGSGHIVLASSLRELYPIDNIYQFTHRGSNLSDGNFRASQNDAQLKAVQTHYNYTFHIENGYEELLPRAIKRGNSE